jgi:hypothetical protein
MGSAPVVQLDRAAGFEPSARMLNRHKRQQGNRNLLRFLRGQGPSRNGARNRQTVETGRKRDQNSVDRKANLSSS